MVNLRIIVVLALMVAWWQKDTLEDRALTHEGITASAAQAAAGLWAAVTPPSPAKHWISARDQWLDDLFNPKQDYSHPASLQPSAPLTHKEKMDDKRAKPAVPAETVGTPKAPNAKNNVIRNDPSHLTPEPTDVFESNAPPSTSGAKTPAAPGSDTKPVVSEAAAQTPVDANIKRILIVGDSMSGDVGLSLRQLAFKYKQKAGVDVQIIDAHRHSTGLVVPSYYDWPRELPTLLTKNEPQVVVFMVGANDGQSMRVNNQNWVLPGSPGWSSEYERRAKQVVATIPPSAKLVWLDLPPVRLKSLQERTALVNDSVKNALSSCKHCLHLETRSTFGGDTYVENTPGNMLRSKDGVHYSRSGASYVASKLWTKLGLPIYD